MGRKKKKPLKPWCWYCNREFIDDKVLIQHQRAKHFKCPICRKKLYSGPGLSIHSIQVHKETLDKVPDALPNRNSIDIEIYGMKGVPSEDLREHERVKRGEEGNNSPPDSPGTSTSVNESNVPSRNNTRHPQTSTAVRPPPAMPPMFPFPGVGFPMMPTPPMMGLPNMPPPPFPPLLPPPPSVMGGPLPPMGGAHPPFPPIQPLLPPPAILSIPPPGFNPGFVLPQLNRPPPPLPSAIVAEAAKSRLLLTKPPPQLPREQPPDTETSISTARINEPPSKNVTTITGLPNLSSIPSPSDEPSLPSLSCIPPPDMPSPDEKESKDTESYSDNNSISSKPTSVIVNSNDIKNSSSNSIYSSSTPSFKPTMTVEDLNCKIMHPDCDLSLEEIRFTLKRYSQFRNKSKFNLSLN